MLNMSALTGYVRKKTLDDALEADETSESTGICSAVSSGTGLFVVERRGVEVPGEL